MILLALWKAIHARLDNYHQIATAQACQSFRNVQMAKVAGFVLLIVFATLTLYAQSTAVAVVTERVGRDIGGVCRLHQPNLCRFPEDSGHLSALLL